MCYLQFLLKIEVLVCPSKELCVCLWCSGGLLCTNKLAFTLRDGYNNSPVSRNPHTSFELGNLEQRAQFVEQKTRHE